MRKLLLTLLFLPMTVMAEPLDSILYVFIEDCKMGKLVAVFPRKVDRKYTTPEEYAKHQEVVARYNQAPLRHGEHMLNETLTFFSAEGYQDLRVVEVNVSRGECSVIDYTYRDPELQGL